MFTKKFLTSISVITAVIGLLVALWMFDGHYETKAAAVEKIEQVEIVVAGAIQNQEIKSDYKFMQFIYDKLTTEMYNLKRQMRRYSEDQDLKDDYTDVVRQRNEVKFKLDILMKEKLNVPN
jgi:hypothetical protein